MPMSANHNPVIMYAIILIQAEDILQCKVGLLHSLEIQRRSRPVRLRFFYWDHEIMPGSSTGGSVWFWPRRLWVQVPPRHPEYKDREN